MTKVLYIEDNQDVSEIMKDMLKIFFKDVYVAKNGLEGLEAYKKYNPDLVISDIFMPKMDGLKLTKEIYKLNKDAKIILITADNDDKYYKEAKELKVLAYFRKPFDFSQLQSIIDSV